MNRFYQDVKTCPKDQPGKVANPARGQLKQGKIIFPCPRSHLKIWSREKDSAVPSRVSLLISILTLNLVFTYGIPPDFRDMYGHTYMYVWSSHIVEYGSTG